jgi:TPP-dependent pyruvate/acetoin dehydrogenase alpha subunit
VDALKLYELMIRSRLFEEAVKELWLAGLITGEMHLGIGEEAVIAGVVSQLVEGDALALDHRGTSALVMRGVDPVSLLLEFMGHPQGLCRGQGGHMHLFSPEHLAASSGIVGASGPAAVGFALAARYRRQENIAASFFGEGAMNQGMMLESLNLAAAWRLPVLFVCKDNGWSISTHSRDVTGGSLLDRALAFGLPAARVDGLEVEAVARTTGEALAEMRRGGGPFFLLASCVHREGHFLGDPLLRFHDSPFKNYGRTVGPLTRALLSRKGAPLSLRTRGLRRIMSLISGAGKQRMAELDPLARARAKRPREEKASWNKIQSVIAQEVRSAVREALAVVGGKERP